MTSAGRPAASSRVGDEEPDPGSRASSERAGQEFADEAEDAPVGANVVIEAPEPPRRAHRPMDLVRLLVALGGLAVVLLIGAFTTNTVAGLDADVQQATAPLAGPVLVLMTGAAGLLVLALPVGVAVDLLVRRRVRTLADSLLAVVAGLGAATAFTTIVLNLGPGHPLARSLIGADGAGSPVAGVVVGVVALATVARLGQRPWWRGIAAAVFVLVGVALISIGYTALAVVVSLVLGRAVGLFARWALGSAPSRPSPRAVVAALAGTGIDVRVLRPRRPESADPAYYDVLDADGRPLVVRVLDRDQEGADVLSALWRTLRFRQAANRRALLSLRRALEHEVLLGLALGATGANVQLLVAAVPVDPDATVVAYFDVPGPTLAEAQPHDLTDARLDAAWEQVELLHRKAVAHRALGAENIVLTEDGGVGLRTAPAVLVAAGRTAIRLDRAQLLVALALAVGPERAVRSALRVLGPRRLATTVPLLQPVVLGRSTRRAVKAREGLLDTLRSAIVDAVPSAPVHPVRIERLRPRFILSAVALTVAAYVLVGQVAGLDMWAIIRAASWQWLLVAAVLSAVRYVGAALAVQGFVAERLAFLRTTVVQVAGSFLALVAPAGVGVAALNVRYLQRSGLPAAAAVASVALWQAGTIGSSVLLVVVLSAFTGASSSQELSVPGWALVVLAVAVAAGALALAVPAVRRLLLSRARPYLDQVRPRIGLVFTRPVRLLTGIVGTLLQSLFTVLVMVASIRAFGGSVPWTLVAVVVLAGTALGSAAPTPGGLGAVEAVLSAGLTAGGLDGGTAVSAVLLFRLLTFWLPVVPGWVAFSWLQRRQFV